MNTLMAEIPLLDWNGPAFLAFYVVAYVTTLIWSRRRLQTVLRPFENRSASMDLEPYEVAFLSGGPNRVTQMAVAQLILSGAAVWKKKLLGPRLIAVAAGEPVGLKSVEKQLWELLVKAGSKGLAVNTLTFQLKPNHAALETRLAIRGLRPSGGERSSAAFRAVLPLLGLLALGGVKLLIGISRDRPVLFLFFLMILTLVTAVAVAGNVPRVTGKGEGLLGELRSTVPAQVTGGTVLSDMAFMSFALFGPTAFEDIPGFGQVADQMEKHMAPSASGGADSSGGSCGSGCSSSGSSGCSSGSSGCGGGGCGGCGGS